MLFPSTTNYADSKLSLVGRPEKDKLIVLIPTNYAFLSTTNNADFMLSLLGRPEKYQVCWIS